MREPGRTETFRQQLGMPLIVFIQMQFRIPLGRIVLIEKPYTFVCFLCVCVCVTLQKYKFVTTKQEKQRTKKPRPMEDPDNGGTNMHFKIFRIKMFKIG